MSAKALPMCAMLLESRGATFDVVCADDQAFHYVCDGRFALTTPPQQASLRAGCMCSNNISNVQAALKRCIAVYTRLCPPWGRPGR